jgi:hypothetical protein
MPPGDPTVHIVKANGPTAHPMALTTSLVPRAATTTPASPSTPCVALMTLTSTFAPCGLDDSSHLLLGGTHLASDRLTGASRAASRCSPCLSHGSSTSDVDPRGCRHSLSRLKSVWAALVVPHLLAAMEEEYATLMSNDT